MDKPDYLIVGKQQQIYAGLNAFALELVAESFADDRSKFVEPGKSILCVNRAHNGTPVYIWISAEMPAEWTAGRLTQEPEGSLG
jgi:hypothetical protein